jgi:integrase
MGRYQRGYIYEAFGAFHVRYRTEEIVDGQPKRAQRSHRLCTKDKQHASVSSKSVRRVCDEFMATVNAQVPGQPQEQALTIAAFWEHTYWPFEQENLKPSTVYGYKQNWDNHLKDHFGEMTLKDYKTPMMTVFLTGVRGKHGERLRPRSLKHIKFLASALFSHAVATGNCETNPIRDAKVLGKTLGNGETKSYTLEEIEDVISALVDHVQCQLIMALAFFLGLRKGEIACLQWNDIDGGYVHVRRALSRGVVGTPKTKKSIRSIPIIQPVGGLLSLWRAKCPTEQVWLFPNEDGTPQDLDALAAKIIRPALAKEELAWKGFHAGRRGLGTILRELTGNSTAGRDVLGHEDEGVTKDHYEDKLPEEALKGMRWLEAKVNGK